MCCRPSLNEEDEARMKSGGEGGGGGGEGEGGSVRKEMRMKYDMIMI